MGKVWYWRAAGGLMLYAMVALGFAWAAAMSDGALPPLQRLARGTTEWLPGTAAWATVIQSRPDIGLQGAAWGVLLLLALAVAAFTRAEQLQRRLRALDERRRREAQMARDDALRAKLRSGDTVRMRVGAAANPEDWV